jgi:hypothetical protein
MRPDDRASALDDLVEPGMDLPFDAELESLHDDLAAAGQHARRMLYGRTQFTRLFSNQLRAHLLGAGSAPGTLPTGAAPAASGELRGSGGADAHGRHGTREEPAPIGRAAHLSGFSLSVPPRTLLAVLTIAGMAAVLALGALSGTFGPPLP